MKILNRMQKYGMHLWICNAINLHTGRSTYQMVDKMNNQMKLRWQLLFGFNVCRLRKLWENECIMCSMPMQIRLHCYACFTHCVQSPSNTNARQTERAHDIRVYEREVVSCLWVKHFPLWKEHHSTAPTGTVGCTAYKWRDADIYLAWCGF